MSDQEGSEKTQALMHALSEFVGTDIDSTAEELAEYGIDLSVEQVEAIRYGRVTWVVETLRGAIHEGLLAEKQDTETLNRYFEEEFPHGEDSQIGQDHFRYLADSLGIDRRASGALFSDLLRVVPKEALSVRFSDEMDDDQIARILRDRNYTDIKTRQQFFQVPREARVATGIELEDLIMREGYMLPSRGNYTIQMATVLETMGKIMSGEIEVDRIKDKNMINLEQIKAAFEERLTQQGSTSASGSAKLTIV